MLSSAATPYIVFSIGFLIMVAVLANRISGRLGIPTLLVFIAVGMLAGSDGPGGIEFDNPAVANLIGVFALAYILFSGGLDTKWSKVKGVAWHAAALATLGVGISAALVGIFASYILDFTIWEGLLVGSIISSTDAAAVFAVLRSRGVSLKGDVAPLLEFESGSNYPMAVFLTLGVLGVVMDSSQKPLWLLLSFVFSMTGGLALGLAFGFLTSFILNRLRLEYEGLYPVLSISVVLLTYGSCEILHANGFLAVYVAGIVLSSNDIHLKRYLMKFHDGIGWLMQILLFVTLGLLVYPSQLPSVLLPAVLIATFLMFVARPVAVYSLMIRSRFTMAERTLVAWTGLRGAVPIVLATFPLLAGHPKSNMIFDIVFFVVLLSALLQGKSLMMVARWLGVDEPLVDRPQSPIEFEHREGVGSEAREIDVPPSSAIVGKRVFQLGLPPGVLIVMIRRDHSFIVPRGDTCVRAYDTLHILGEKSALAISEALVEQQAPHRSDDQDPPSGSSSGDAECERAVQQALPMIGSDASANAV